ncbi:MAG TPA: TRAP transporter substrate-binding protein DctP [Anaeromyxobacter sp.]
MPRAIPPDPNAAGARNSGYSQHEAIGDLHLAADAFGNAVEAYRAALAETPASAAADRIRLLLRMARAEQLRGRPQDGLTNVQAARAIARRVGNPRLNAFVAGGMAVLQTEMGSPRRALRYATYGYRVLRDTNEHDAVAQISLSMGLALTRSGQPQQAIDWLQSAAAMYRRVENADGLVSALNNLGLVYKNLREWREATRYLEQALEIDERKGLFARMRGHHQNLGLIRYRLGQWELAEEHFRHSLRISREISHAGGEAGAMLALGMLARRRRQLDRAEDHFRQAQDLATRTGARRETVLDAQMRALGALPHVMAFSDVYPALKAGVVDGTENPISNLYTQRMHEVQKHLTLTNHGYLGYATIVNKRFWDGLPGDVREKLQQAMAEATEYANRIAKEKNDEDLERVRAARTTEVHVPTPAERLALEKALAPVHTQMADRIGRDLIRSIYRATGFAPDRL